MQEYCRVKRLHSIVLEVSLVPRHAMPRQTYTTNRIRVRIFRQKIHCGLLGGTTFYHIGLKMLDHARPFHTNHLVIVS